jgi:hypothetical protein
VWAAKRARLSAESDLRRIVLDRMWLRKSEYRATLAAMPTADLLIWHFNWIGRFVPPQPREVLRSKEISGNPDYLRHRADIDRLIAKIRIGIDITPHLSAQVRTGYEEDKRGRPGKQSLDLLLNDWGVHHLHFGHALRQDGFVERPESKPELLFVIFRPGAAYVLDVFAHHDWAHDRIAEIAVRNWPDRSLFLRLGVKGGGRPFTVNQRQALRRGHMSAPIEIAGGVFTGHGCGISGAGTSARTAFRVSRLCRSLAAYEADEDLIVAHMRRQPNNIGLRIPVRPSFEVVDVLTPLGFGFARREKKFGALLPLE